jgi:hypothetical protein
MSAEIERKPNHQKSAIVSKREMLECANPAPSNILDKITPARENVRLAIRICIHEGRSLTKKDKTQMPIKVEIHEKINRIIR